VPAPLNRYTSEWVELFNTTAERIDLRGWRIDDADDGGAITLEGALDPGGYLVITLPRAILNNSGDTVRLFGPDGTLIDSFSYGHAERDTSFDRDMLTGVWKEERSTVTTTDTPTANDAEQTIARIPLEPSASPMATPVHHPPPSPTATWFLALRTTPITMDPSGQVYQFRSTAEVVPERTAPPMPLEAATQESPGAFRQPWMVFSGLGLIILACFLVMSRPTHEFRWDT
jgi:hypothetical protein